MKDIIAYLPLLLQGLKLTLMLAVSTLVIGVVLGMALAMAKLSRHAWLSRPVYAVTNFLRGIPEFLVLLVIYFGGTQVLDSILPPGSVQVSPFGAGLTALSLIFGAYASETFRGAFQSVHKGQLEAGRAYGFTAFQTFRYIQLPQIWKVAIPGLGNLWQGSVKDTALVSIVGLDDLMRKANQAAQTTREPFTFYMVASLMFLAITLCLDAADRLARAARQPRHAGALRMGGILDIVRTYGWDFLAGTWLTVQLVAISAVLGVMLAVPVALARLSRNPLLRGIATAYSLFFRGTPLLVQIFLIYFGLGQFDLVRDSFLWPLLREAYVCALLTFVLNTAAYSGEIVRGGILAVPRGEIEAAKAAGMSSFTTYRLIILPRAFSIILPAYSNEVIILLKGTSLASTITLLELMGQAQLAASDTYQPIQVFAIAGVIYYVLTLAITNLFRLLERRFNRYMAVAR